jgi:hypothetical protein
VLDLAHVDGIDACGLGVLLGVREWARANAIRFKLMNAMNKVERILELTRLDRVFEFCSVRDWLFLLHRAALMTPCRVEPNPAHSWECTATQHALSVNETESLLGLIA